MCFIPTSKKNTINWSIELAEMRRTQTLGIFSISCAIAPANRSSKNFSKMTVVDSYSDVSGRKCSMKNISHVPKERILENQARQNRQKMGLVLTKRTWLNSETIRMRCYSIEITVHCSRNYLLSLNTNSMKESRC